MLPLHKQILHNNLPVAKNIALLEAKTLFKYPSIKENLVNLGDSIKKFADDPFTYKPQAPNYHSYYFMGWRKDDTTTVYASPINNRSSGSYIFIKVAFSQTGNGTTITLIPYIKPKYFLPIFFATLLIFFAIFITPFLWFTNNILLSIVLPPIVACIFMLPIYLGFKWRLQTLLGQLHEIFKQ